MCSTTTTTTYTIGGTVSGTLRTGLVLQNNGGDNLAIAGDGTFTFATAIAASSAYDVAVLTQTVESDAGLHGRGWQRNRERQCPQRKCHLQWTIHLHHRWESFGSQQRNGGVAKQRR